MTTDSEAEADEPPSSASADRDISCDLTLDWAAPDVDPPADGWLLDRLDAAVRGAGVGPVTLALRVVGDEEMDRFHRAHGGVPGTTDVLTFDNRNSPGNISPGSDSPEEPIDGDLLLCRDEAVRRAEELGHDARLELLLYAVHGLLHLAGEDDHDPASHRRMHEREDEILRGIGLGPVYAAPRSAP